GGALRAELGWKLRFATSTRRKRTAEKRGPLPPAPAALRCDSAARFNGLATSAPRADSSGAQSRLVRFSRLPLGVTWELRYATCSSLPRDRRVNFHCDRGRSVVLARRNRDFTFIL